MENKYYTPELEEFHVGFEYEYFENGKWRSIEVYDIDFEYDTKLLKEKRYRVKYLDQEDIESLGFSYEKTMSLGSLRKSYWTGDDKVVGRILTKEDGSMMCWNMAIHVFKNNHVKIEAQMSDAETYTFFEGIIKNKSELKKLLKQIGYEKS